MELTRDERAMLKRAQRQGYGAEPLIYALLGTVQVLPFIAAVSVGRSTTWEDVSRTLVWVLVWILLYMHARFCRTAYGLIEKLNVASEPTEPPGSVLALSGPSAPQ